MYILYLHALLFVSMSLGQVIKARSLPARANQYVGANERLATPL